MLKSSLTCFGISSSVTSRYDANNFWKQEATIKQQDEFDGELCHSITITNACFGHILHAERTEDSVKIYGIIDPQIVEIEHDASIDILHRAQTPNCDREWADRQHALEGDLLGDRLLAGIRETSAPRAQPTSLELLARVAEPIRPAIPALAPVVPTPAQKKIAMRRKFWSQCCSLCASNCTDSNSIRKNGCRCRLSIDTPILYGVFRKRQAHKRSAKSFQHAEYRPPLDRVSKTKARFDCNSITDVRQHLDAIKNVLDFRNYGRTRSSRQASNACQVCTIIRFYSDTGEAPIDICTKKLSIYRQFGGRLIFARQVPVAIPLQQLPWCQICIYQPKKSRNYQNQQKKTGKTKNTKKLHFYHYSMEIIIYSPVK
ncbi:unnamed protein product [Caenorhabditis angaria]|uniref:Uncharacterized protein n=1 Tax=Caenorhabditis angaria TaxID=860376 RepID=A0A9P1J124_9PELO|nr:unnamed protein product [Caenorhabditis angaria]